MKKIIQKESSEISINNLPEFPIIGFVVDDVRKGFLIPCKYKSKKYYARLVDLFEKGDGFDGVEGKTLKDWTNCFRCPVNFYAFDTNEELFKWLSEP